MSLFSLLNNDVERKGLLLVGRQYECFGSVQEGPLKTSTKNLDQSFSRGHIECGTLHSSDLQTIFVRS